jgi:hypothetical protein
VVDQLAPVGPGGYRAFWGGGKLPPPPQKEQLVAVKDTMAGDSTPSSGNNIHASSPVVRRSSNISRVTIDSTPTAVEDGSGDSRRHSDAVSTTSSQNNMSYYRGPISQAGPNDTPPASRVRHTVLAAPTPSHQASNQTRTPGPTSGRTWVLKSKTSSSSVPPTSATRPARLDLGMLGSDVTPAIASPMPSPRSAGPFAIGPQPQYSGGTIAPATGSPRLSTAQLSPQPWAAYDDTAALDRLSMRSNRSDRSRNKTPLAIRQDAANGRSEPIAIPVSRQQADSSDRFVGSYSPPVDESILSSQSGSATSSVHSVVIYDEPSLSLTGGSGPRTAWFGSEDPLLHAMEPRDSESPPTPLASSQSHVSFVAANVSSSQQTMVEHMRHGSSVIVAADLDETSMV